MRHRKKTRKLSRDYDHRRALLRNLARSFFMHGQIKSSRAKIIASQRFVERLISRGKKDNLAARRYLYRFWPDRHFVAYLLKIFQQLKGQSGFTRIRPWQLRKGDSTMIYRLEFSQPVQLKDENRQPAVKAKKTASKTKEDKKTPVTKKPIKKAKKETDKK